MTTSEPISKTIYRKDYQSPQYLVQDVHLDVFLDEEETLVVSTLLVCAAREDAADLILDGEDLVLKEVWLAGRLLSPGEYRIGSEGEIQGKLIISKDILPTQKLMKPFQLVIKNTNCPRDNLRLSGLYKSNNLLVTQMESEGYRRFAFNVDRPDNLSRYTVRVEADKALYPVLLSNGDEIAHEENLPNNKHSKTFYDPFKKPSYLFAIIAGPLKWIHDTFVTMATVEEPSKEVDLYVYCDEKYLTQVEWAMECAKRAMKWDEVKYGRVYDLSTFSIVAIDAFNAGAMENKSLTTYNVSCVLASPATSTDSTFETVLAVIGHEYFHNWSGNRVTVKDWFQITLKEGFTGFRENNFARDEFSTGAKRVQEIAYLRASQFPEDSGPMSHPIRPESYQSIDNFYTATVYSKGAEVIGCLRTLVGEAGFRKGTDLYFSRFDGKAVSCDDFRNTIGEANGRDFTQFERWYSQKGTPTLRVQECQWNELEHTYHLTIQQILPTDANPCGEAQPLQIPILLGLIGKKSCRDLIPTTLIELTGWQQSFVIQDVPEDCLPSFLRDFSAPVRVEPFLSKEELGFLSAYDTDAFSAWDCAQSLFTEFLVDRAQRVLNNEIQIETDEKIPDHILRCFKEGLKNRFDDMEFVSCFLCFPSTKALTMEMRPVADPVILSEVARHAYYQIKCELSDEMEKQFTELWEISKKAPFEVTKEATGRRSLQSTLLSFLTNVQEKDVPAAAQRLLAYYKAAKCFHDKKVAASLICHFVSHERDELIADMYELCKNDNNMLDGWFSMQARSLAKDTLARIEKLQEHPDFKDTKNPNRWRALIGAISGNAKWFHDRSGKGYKIVAREVERFDKFNAYTASIVCKALIDYAR